MDRISEAQKGVEITDDRVCAEACIRGTRPTTTKWRGPKGCFDPVDHQWLQGNISCQIWRARQ